MPYDYVGGNTHVRHFGPHLLHQRPVLVDSVFPVHESQDFIASRLDRKMNELVDLVELKRLYEAVYDGHGLLRSHHAYPDHEVALHPSHFPNEVWEPYRATEVEAVSCGVLCSKLDLYRALRDSFPHCVNYLPQWVAPQFPPSDLGYAEIALSGTAVGYRDYENPAVENLRDSRGLRPLDNDLPFVGLDHLDYPLDCLGAQEGSLRSYGRNGGGQSAGEAAGNDQLLARSAQLAYPLLHPLFGLEPNGAGVQNDGVSFVNVVDYDVSALC